MTAEDGTSKAWIVANCMTHHSLVFQNREFLFVNDLISSLKKSLQES